MRDRICLQTLNFHQEVYSPVRQSAIAFLLTIMVIILNAGNTFLIHIHLTELKLSHVAKNHASHGRIIFDQIGQISFTKFPTV